MIYASKKTIMPFVVLYEGVFDNASDILEMLKESDTSRVLLEWEPWYELGQRTRLEFIEDTNLSDIEKKQLAIHDNIYFNLIETYKDYVSDWTKPHIIEQYKNPNRSFYQDWKYVFGEIVTDWDSFDKIPDNPKKDSWIKSAVEILKHDHLAGEGLELAIGYHIDAFNSKDAAGPKSIITGTVYLNDDYEGGEISFLNEFDSTIVTYKPKKGDLIVFPSAKPFFHAAQKMSGSDKYLIRHFLLWDHSGSEKYKEGEKKFGSEQWQVMQEYIRETEDLMGFYQKDVYLPGVSVFEREHGNGIPFFPKSVDVWKG
jgi:hypothetical protein